MKNKLIVILFIVFLALGGIALSLFPKEAYSEDENRLLAEKPKLTWAGVTSGVYMEEVEMFVDDYFPLRLKWIQLKTTIEQAAGRTEVNGVFLTDEGYFIESFSKYDTDQFEKNKQNLIAFAKKVEAISGDKLQVLLAPTAAHILNAYLPKFDRELNQQTLLDEVRNEAFELVNVIPALVTHTQERIYYYTDHHWTSLGAYYAYQAWQPNTKPLAAYEKELLSDEFLGTLYSKVKIKPKHEDEMFAYYFNEAMAVEYNLDGQWHNDFYARNYLKGKDKYAAYFNGNQSITKIKGYGDQGKLLIIKDSYANSFAQFTVSDFTEIHLIDLRYFKLPLSEWIEKEQYDEVLLLYNLKNFTEENLFLLK